MKYLVVESRILQCRELEANEKLLLAVLVSFSNVYARVTISNKGAAQTLGVCEKTVANLIKNLEEKGFIAIEHFDIKGGRKKRAVILTHRTRQLVDYSPDTSVNLTPAECKPYTRSRVQRLHWNINNNINNNNNTNMSSFASDDTCKDIHNVDNSPDNPPPDEKKKRLDSDARIVLDYINEQTGRRMRPTPTTLTPIIKALKAGYKKSELSKVVQVKVNQKFFKNNKQFFHPESLFRNKTRIDKGIDEYDEWQAGNLDLGGENGSFREKPEV